MLKFFADLGVQHLGVMFTYNIPFLMVKLFLMWNSVLPSSESKCSPMHVLSKASLFCQSKVLFCTHPLMAGSQQHILTLCFFPTGRVHRCQLEGMGMCFFIQVITLHSQGSADEDLSSLCHASYRSFQERSYHIFVMSHWHSAEHISHHIVWSFLVF